MTVARFYALLVCCLMALCLANSPAFAEEPQPSEPAQFDEWTTHFKVARGLLLRGKYGEAKERFALLTVTAPTPEKRAAAEALGQLSADLEGQGQRPGDQVSGQRSTDEIAMLYTSAVLYGIGTGAYLAVLTEPDSPAAAILPALALAGGAAAAVYAFDSPYRYGVPQSAASGLWIGLSEGMLLMTWQQSRVKWEDEWSGKTASTVVWALGTVGFVGGGILGNALDTTPGRASWMGSLAMWTALVGGLTTAAIVGDEGNDDENIFLVGAIGLNAGVLAAVFTADLVSPSTGRVRFIDLGGLSGALVFGGFYFAIAGDNPTLRGGTGALALGTALGLGAAWVLTAEMDRDEPSQPVSFLLAPLDGGGMAMVGGRF